MTSMLQVVRWLTECGNGVVEGEEQCDDGNLDGGDGCSPVCKVGLYSHKIILLRCILPAVLFPLYITC